MWVLWDGGGGTGICRGVYAGTFLRIASWLSGWQSE
jgi:hypothetical protein